MQSIEAARALSALGHETRLSVFRALVQAGPDGLAAGDIARLIDLAPNALSFHLKDLTYAGLIESRQSGRFVIYSAAFPVINGLVAYLTENCCGGAECVVSGTSRSEARSMSRKVGSVTAAQRGAAGTASRKKQIRG